MEVPESSFAIRKAALAHYPKHTTKRRMLRFAVDWGFRCGILSWVCPARPFSLEGMTTSRFEDWISHLAKVLGQAVIHPLIAWPGDPDRGRLYLYLLDGGGKMVAFAKLALDENNGKSIRNEATVLQQFQKRKPRTFQVPDLLAAGDWDGAQYLVSARVPAQAMAVDWDHELVPNEIVAEIGDGRRWREADHPPSWWFSILDACRNFPEFNSAVRKAGKKGWELCRVHGDLNRTNVLRDGEVLWIIDWEQSLAEGPGRADEVCLTIDRWWNQNKGNPGQVERRECQETLFADKQDPAGVVVALAFLHSLHFFPATALIREWTAADTETFGPIEPVAPSSMTLCGNRNA